MKSAFHFPVKSLQTDLLKWYGEHKAPHPWRLDWYKNRNPYPIWVSEIMLQQTTLSAMIPVYQKFITRFSTVRELAHAQEEDVKKTVQGLGYYRRFALLHKGARKIVDTSTIPITWPKNYEEWIKIPGVGDYTASALSSITLNEATPVLDGNVIRVLCRIFDIQKPANDLSLKKTLKELSIQLISHEDPGSFNQAIMELGQKICRPLSPNCENCPLQKMCKAFKNQSTHLAPQPKTRKETKVVNMRLHILQDGDRYALFQRSDKAKFLRESAGFLSELFDGEIFKVDGDETNKQIPKGIFLGNVRHNITHHQIHVEVFLLKGDGFKGLENFIWYEKKDLRSHLISSLDLKAWALFQTSNQRDVYHQCEHLNFL